MLTCSVSIPVFDQSAQQVSQSHRVGLKDKQRFTVTEGAENGVRMEGDEGSIEEAGRRVGKGGSKNGKHRRREQGGGMERWCKERGSKREVGNARWWDSNTAGVTADYKNDAARS